MSAWVSPDWVEAVWPDLQEALKADVDNSQWRRAAAAPAPDMAHAMRYVRAWRDVLGTTVLSLRWSLIVWWWSETGETRHPWPDEVKALAMERL